MDYRTAHSLPRLVLRHWQKSSVLCMSGCLPHAALAHKNEEVRAGISQQSRVLAGGGEGQVQ
jgi:hypothetical protein